VNVFITFRKKTLLRFHVAAHFCHRCKNAGEKNCKRSVEKVKKVKESKNAIVACVTAACRHRLASSRVFFVALAFDQLTNGAA